MLILNLAPLYEDQTKRKLQGVLAIHDFVVHDFAIHGFSEKSNASYFTFQICNSRKNFDSDFLYENDEKDCEALGNELSHLLELKNEMERGWNQDAAVGRL